MKRHVLYVEDEEDFQILVRKILQRAGLEVRMADTAEAAYREMERETPSALLLDINLPDASGFDICARIRRDARWMALPIVMLSVRRKPEEWLRGFSSGASDYLSKPIQPRDLLERLLQNMEGHAPEGANATAEYKLVRAIVAGNRAAYRVLVEKYRKRLIESFGPLIVNDVLLEDVIAQAFATALSRLGEFRGESSFFTWLYRIAMNAYIGTCRKPSALPIEDILGDQECRIAWPFQNPLAEEDDLARQEFSRNIRARVEEIPAPFKKTLELYCFEDMSYEAIARRLRIPEGTVMSRLHKARKLLQDAWIKYHPAHPL